jgi:hypothetical protein
MLQKHSKTPKSRQKHSKFKRMKERLQYKFVSQGVQEEPVPLQTVPPSDEPAIDVPEHPVHDDEKLDEEDEEDNVVDKKVFIVTLFFCFYCMLPLFSFLFLLMHGVNECCFSCYYFFCCRITYSTDLHQ